MRKEQNDVKAFMQAFGQEVADKPTAGYEDVRRLRCKLIQEEFEEFIEASGYDLEDYYAGGSFIESGAEPNLPEMIDGLTDLLYVILGAFNAFGVDAEDIFNLVHENNMQKTKGRRCEETGKWLKPDGFVGPDISAALEAQAK